MRCNMVPDEPALERARGHIELRTQLRHGRTRLSHLYQSGSGKLRLPRTPDPLLEAVLINSSGGLTDGDRFAVHVVAGPGSRTLVTSQAAEKIYRSRGAAAHTRLRLVAEAGAFLEWLPQETILFDRGRLRRSLDLEIAADGRCLLVESIVVGRRAMGETVRDGALHDNWTIRVAGELRRVERLRLDGDLAALLDRPALGGGARALATLLYVGADAELWLGPVRERLEGLAVTGAASVCRGVLALRLLASSGDALRPAVRAILASWRCDLHERAVDLPRVWSC